MTTLARPELSGASYAEIYERFRWRVPRHFNIGTACADAQPREREALLHVDDDGSTRRYTFGDLARLSNKVANGLLGLGFEPGDRVAVALEQRPEAALLHLGVFKAGLISVPLSALFGIDAFRHRLADSEARAILTDAAGAEKVEALSDIPGPEWLLVVDEDPAPDERRRGFDRLVEGASDRLEEPRSRPLDPCLLIYTSGTTGPPKGVLHGHQVLIGQAPGFRLCHDFIPQPGDLMWTPGDWAWIGGLVNTLLLAWFHGVPMVSTPRRKFDPEWALQLMARHGVRNAFLPTTALRMMLACEAPPDLRMRSILAGGEAQEAALFEAAKATFGIPFNEAYGQTEADFVVGHCHSRWPIKPGSMGRAYPGHDVRVLDPEGGFSPAGEVGEVVIRMPDPTALIEYWRRPEATRDKLEGGWLRTDDLASVDADGYMWFKSRADDVIKSAGYRIGPDEVEDCLRRHEAVANAGAIGVPDETRGHVVKAYVELHEGFRASAELEEELKAHVKQHLAAYEYPRLLEFVESLPLTSSGKIARNELRRRGAGAGARPS